MKAKANNTKSKQPTAKVDLFTRRLTTLLMVQSGILPRSYIGLKEPHNYEHKNK